MKVKGLPYEQRATYVQSIYIYHIMCCMVHRGSNKSMKTVININSDIDDTMNNDNGDGNYNDNGHKDTDHWWRRWW